jgi:plastocyanin
VAIIFQEILRMQNRYRYKFAAMFSAAILVVFGLAVLRPGVQAAPPSGGGVSGMIKLDGVAPHQRPIDMSKEPGCAAEHKDKPITGEAVVVGPNGGLANVVIYVSQGWHGSEAATSPSEVVNISQKGCQYLPHVVVVEAGQHLKVVNSDQTLHNVHPQPMNNEEWNKSQQPGAQPFDVAWSNPEVAVPIKCNIHPWMRGYVAVVKGPHAITDRTGSYSLKLSPGKYTITAWQETYGSQTQNVTVEAGKPAVANFTFQVK